MLARSWTNSTLLLVFFGEEVISKPRPRHKVACKWVFEDARLKFGFDSNTLCRRGTSYWQWFCASLILVHLGCYSDKCRRPLFSVAHWFVRSGFWLGNLSFCRTSLRSKDSAIKIYSTGESWPPSDTDTDTELILDPPQTVQSTGSSLGNWLVCILCFDGKFPLPT